MTKTIMCFGDSNTFGLKPNPLPWTRERWDVTERWPSILATHTGLDVISEGLPGRTAATVNTAAPHLDALPIIPALMESHTPVDLVIVMLGTNDLQTSAGLTPQAVTIAMSALVKALKRSDRVVGADEPKILVIAPPPVKEVGFRSVSFAGAAAKSRQLAPLYEDMATSLGVAFLDAGLHAKVSDIDGIHLDAAQHYMLAHTIMSKLQNL